mgnify:CR=1 FL=1
METIHQKDDFFSNLNEMLEICMFSEGKINDKDLLEIADNYKGQYKKIKDLMDENNKLKELVKSIKKNKFYQSYKVSTTKRRLLTFEEKTRNENYSNCKYCDNICKISYMEKHYLNKCCSENQLKKEIASKKKHVHIKYNKATQLLNMYIRVCLYNNKRNGAYWKTIELMKFGNYL